MEQREDGWHDPFSIVFDKEMIHALREELALCRGVVGPLQDALFGMAAVVFDWSAIHATPRSRVELAATVLTHIEPFATGSNDALCHDLRSVANSKEESVKAQDEEAYRESSGGADRETGRKNVREEDRESSQVRGGEAEHGAGRLGSPSTTWRCDFGGGIRIRMEPNVAAAKVGNTTLVKPGEEFLVSEERQGADNILYLRLANGQGWVFDSTPKLGALAARLGPPLPPFTSDADDEAVPNEMLVNAKLAGRAAELAEELAATKQQVRTLVVASKKAASLDTSLKARAAELTDQLAATKQAMKALLAEHDAATAELETTRRSPEKRALGLLPLHRVVEEALAQLRAALLADVWQSEEARTVQLFAREALIEALSVVPLRVHYGTLANTRGAGGDGLDASEVAERVQSGGRGAKFASVVNDPVALLDASGADSREATRAPVGFDPVALLAHCGGDLLGRN